MTNIELTPDVSRFRFWFRNCLRELPGNTLEWPVLLRQIIEEELRQLRNSDQYYAGAIFRNRDEKVNNYRTRESQDEEILVYHLYHAVHQRYRGVLNIGDTPVWLFSCEVPNQGKELSYRTKKRRADLLGLRQDGSLMVFECKGPENRNDSPLYGLLEGLDYLGCLLTSKNVVSLNDDLQDWLVEHRPSADRFSSAIPEWPSFTIAPAARHGVIVLAPQSYYDIHIARSSDWWLLSDRFVAPISGQTNVNLDFAVVDYEQGHATWLELPNRETTSCQDQSTSIESTATEQPLPRDLIWLNGEEKVAVTKVRRGGRNTRISLGDGTTRVVPNVQLRPAPTQ